MPQNQDKFATMLEELAAEYPELEVEAMQLQAKMTGGEEDLDMEEDVMLEEEGDELPEEELDAEMMLLFDEEEDEEDY